MFPKEYYRNMRYAVNKYVVVILVFGAGCCTLAEPRMKPAKTSEYICQWMNIEVTEGVSLVSGENPKEVSVKKLTENATAFRVKNERTMECHAVSPSKPSKKTPPRNIQDSPSKPKSKRGPKIQYINNNEI